MKSLIKRFLHKFPEVNEIVKKIVMPLKRWLIRRRCYRADITKDRSHFGWSPPSNNYWKLSSELIFFHHKLEKGLCLPPGSRQFFGEAAARKTVELLRRWVEFGLSTDMVVYQQSLAVLEAYLTRVTPLAETNPKITPLIDLITPLLKQKSISLGLFETPIYKTSAPPNCFDTLELLSKSRRSTRDFSKETVDLLLVTRAIELAQLSPSACNRQPWKVHIYEDLKSIEKMLLLQNGNAGFGHTVPLLAVITSDLNTFFDSTERMEPVLDGGLFLMSFILGLQALGLSSCCLNWCVEPEIDKRGHELGGIPSSEKILTYLAIGYARKNCVVPLSGRRSLDDVVYIHRLG